MAYSDFTFSKLKKEYNIKQKDVFLFNDIAISQVTPSSRLAADIQESKGVPLLSEKAKSEYIIAPIIREIKRNNPQITVFSGYALNIQMQKGLNGTPDFMISAAPNIVELQRPIFCLFESKNKDPDEGFAQCINYSKKSDEDGNA